jgi:hypothetical protein
MTRLKAVVRLSLAVALVATAAGCGGDAKDASPNPELGELNKSGPPPRGGVPDASTAGKKKS